MTERNVLGGELDPCGTDPLTGFHRDGTCTVGAQDVGLHAVCAVMTEEFLAHQASVGNDLSTPRPEWHFPGLVPGDRWCVVAVRWLQAYDAGVGRPGRAVGDVGARAGRRTPRGAAGALRRRASGPQRAGLSSSGACVEAV